MDRAEANRWRFIIWRDMQLASYSLAMGHGAKEYLRLRLDENEAILFALASWESMESDGSAFHASYAA